MKNLRMELKRNNLTIGSWLTLSHTSIPEIMAQAGFDWLAIDLEHSAITLGQAQQLMQVVALSQIVPLVRVGENNPYIIKRVMDAGAYGVIVPMVNTREDALKAVMSVKYPPVGNRGVGLARAQGYGLRFKEYKQWVNKNSIVIVQIEHIDAINNLEEILSVEGVDASIIGPYDLSASLDKPGEFEDKKLLKAIKRYEEICRKMKKPMGFHVVRPDAKLANFYKKRGYRFLAVGLDTLYLGEKCLEVINNISLRK